MGFASSNCEVNITYILEIGISNLFGRTKFGHGHLWHMRPSKFGVNNFDAYT